MNKHTRWTDLLLPLGLIGCLMIIFVPLPPSVMDVLLAANITVAVIILLSTIYVKTPLELSVFPSLLLATTLARLALNIGTTRLILTRGHIDGELAAGGVIQSFGEFVAGNNIAVGLVIFAIIIVIQFVVITKGATRISEVAARFALDAMPGKQMAIDAELNAGTIDNEQAKEMRAEVAAHADFYGAMDGASKFVRGDAIAGVLITAINIAGGLIIGLSYSMSIPEAAAVFTKLTVGDGLASQLPALLISLAAGLLVTRSTNKVDLPRESLHQLFGRPTVLFITAAFLGVMAFTNLPMIPLLIITFCCLGIAIVLGRSEKSLQASNQTSNMAEMPKPAPPEVTIDKLLTNDVMEMELGVKLIKLADPRQGGHLLNSITQVRKELAHELGMILPKVRVRDNLQLEENQYRILLMGSVLESGTLYPECSLAVDTGKAFQPIDPQFVKGIFNDSVHAEPAYWVEEDTANHASEAGYVLMTATDVLADQLKQLSINQAPHLLTRDATKQLIDEVKKSAPAVVDELIPGSMSLAQVQKVLKGLLSEQISIRPLSLILETLGDHASFSDNHWNLLERVRQALGRHITSSFADDTRTLSVFTMAPDLQDRVACGWERSNDEIRLDLPRDLVTAIATAIQSAARQMSASGKRPIALVKQSIRPVIAELAFDAANDLIVLGEQEIGDVNVQIVGEITSDHIRVAESSAA